MVQRIYYELDIDNEKDCLEFYNYIDMFYHFDPSKTLNLKLSIKGYRYLAQVNLTKIKIDNEFKMKMDIKVPSNIRDNRTHHFKIDENGILKDTRYVGNTRFEPVHYGKYI